MKVILKEDIKKLGKKDELVDVSDGYARNYLIPRNLAVEANNANISIMKSKSAALMNKKQKELEDAREIAAKLNGKTVIVKTKAGDSGRLYGAVTSMDIAYAIKQQYNIDIDKKKVNLPEPIKAISVYQIEVGIYHQVNAKIFVKVEAE